MNNLSITIPASIVVAGAIIALAIVLSGGGSTTSASSSGSDAGGFGNNQSATADNIQPVTEADYIRGDRSAGVSIVEFSDLECPFCQRLHPTLTRITDEFDGEVNWVYRHFPLTQIHSRARVASLAAECAGSLGDNDAFWQFIDGAFENQRSLGMDLYLNLAQQAGIDRAAFQQCVDDERHDAAVQTDFQDAIDSGGRGTPFVVVINERGETFPFSGALPYAQIKQIVESAIASAN